MRPRNLSHTDESQALVLQMAQSRILLSPSVWSNPPRGLQAAVEGSLNADAEALSGPFDQVQLSAGHREGYLFEKNLFRVQALRGAGVANRLGAPRSRASRGSSQRRTARIAQRGGGRGAPPLGTHTD